ncbi:MAG: SBBP repeat-containing protein [Halobacteriales archaeon]|nr:SBBP repeat-containing protein [Halobacteriales archaeon]
MSRVPRTSLLVLLALAVVVPGLLPLATVAAPALPPAPAPDPLLGPRPVGRDAPAVPVSFEPDAAGFVARAGAYRVLVRSDAVRFGLGGSEVAMRFVGGSPAELRAADLQPGVSNYYVGSDASAWVRGVSHYGRVTMQGVWPGIDVSLHAAGTSVEYDFLLAPGADASRILLQFDGAQSPRIAPDGALLLPTAAGELSHRAPVTWQDLASGARASVASGFRVLEDGTVGVQVGAYDPALPLTIDPVLLYATYVGGTATSPGYPYNGADSVQGVAVDGFGSVYMTGWTGSRDFPVANAIQPLKAGFTDLFITKLDPFGQLVYSTYLGGSENTSGIDIAVTPLGDVTVIGSTQTGNFPVLNPIASGGNVLVRLDPQGQLVRSTYLGYGSALSNGLDAAGNIYIGGVSSSQSFPTTAGAYRTNPNGYQMGFVVSMTPDAGSVRWATLFGGNIHTYLQEIAVTPGGEVAMGGYTYFSYGGFPVKNATQGSPLGDYEGFAAKLAAGGGSLVFSTFVGGYSSDYVHAVAVDTAGDTFVAGTTESTTLPVTSGVAQPTHHGGGQDAFVAKYTSSGALAYTSFLGGSDVDIAYGLAADAAGEAFVTGTTYSINFPLASPYYAYHPGLTYYAPFLTKLSATGSAFLFSTLFGYYGYGYSVVADGPGNVYFGGLSYGTNPRVNASLPNTGGSSGDGWVAAFIQSCGNPPVTTGSPSGTVGTNGWFRSSVTVTLTATSQSCPVPFTSYTLDGGAPQTGRLISITGDRTHTLTYFSRDILGGTESVKTLSPPVKIDTVAPLTTPQQAGLHGTGCWFRSDVAVTLAATDATSGVAKTTFSLDGAPNQTTTSLPASVTVTGAGVHSLTFASTDVAGNVEATRTLTICIDEVAPIVTLTRPGEGNAYVLDFSDPLRDPLPQTIVIGTVSVDADASDDFSGIDRVEFWVDDQLFAADLQAPFEEPWRAGAEALGTHHVMVVAYDRAGNVAFDGRDVLTLPTRVEGDVATANAALATLGLPPLPGIPSELPPIDFPPLPVSPVPIPDPPAVPELPLPPLPDVPALPDLPPPPVNAAPVLREA